MYSVSRPATSHSTLGTSRRWWCTFTSDQRTTRLARHEVCYTKPLLGETQLYSTGTRHVLFFRATSSFLSPHQDLPRRNQHHPLSWSTVHLDRLPMYCSR